MEIVRAMSQNGKVMVTGEHTTMPIMGLGPNPGWDFFIDLPAIVQFSQVMEWETLPNFGLLYLYGKSILVNFGYRWMVIDKPTVSH